MLKKHEKTISKSLLKKIRTSKDKNTKSKRKKENVSNDESRKLKCKTWKAKKHQIIKVIKNKIKITSKIQETNPIMMTCKKDQRTGRSIRRVDRRRVDRRDTAKITVTHKKIFPMMNNNNKRKNVTSVRTKRAISQEDLEGIETSNKTQIQWVMKTMEA